MTKRCMYHIFLGIFHRFAFSFLLILQHFPFHYILAFNFNTRERKVLGRGRGQKEIGEKQNEGRNSRNYLLTFNQTSEKFSCFFLVSSFHAQAFKSLQKHQISNTTIKMLSSVSQSVRKRDMKKKKRFLLKIFLYFFSQLFHSQKRAEERVGKRQEMKRIVIYFCSSMRRDCFN